MPKGWSPVRINTPDAHELADLSLIEEDLGFCIRCCDYFLERKAAPETFRFPGRAFFVAMAISYRRCFKEAVRIWLSPQEIGELLGTEREIHEYLLTLADKHVAHSVNPFEFQRIGFDIAIDESGKLHRGGIRVGGHRVGGLSLEDIDALKRACSRIIAEHVNPRMAACKVRIHEYVETLTDEQLRALPDGLVLYDTQRSDVGRSRRGL